MTHPVTGSKPDKPELHVGWLMPAFFHPLPVDATDPDELADRIVELAMRLLADRSTDEQHFFAQMMLRQTGQLIQAGAEYAGMCFVEHEGEPTMASVLVDRVPSLGESVEAAAEATEALLRRRYPDDEVRTVALPLDGTPAVTRTGGLEVTVPPELAPDGQEQLLPQGIVQAYVPLPGQGETLVFELNSPSPGAWEMYTDMFDAILGTLDWATDEELAERRELERIAGIPAQRGPGDATGETTGGQGPGAHAEAEPEPVEPELAEAVHQRSSLVLDAVGLRGPLREEAGELASVACPGCRAKGLTSGCTVRHHWEMSQLPPETLQEMLAAARAQLIGHGWTEEAVAEGHAVFSCPGDTVSAQGYTCSLTSDAEQELLVVDVATVCRRGTATAVADDFG
ncbi:hypothetical protein K378_01979 [Streptomyces sp. Amel2xB2]|uniref:hypothetical protein n=1 Tax=Streptomyces sp. Amel2xB2 TaxID=1305829 RepID=UPI000DB92CAF|nr:hypothetical protein [Streptomyces sp. Amel2xB2]RAJ69090.1 hypothetical protein K378_01979 [Streptomyces sp. Amel2xB2]